MAELAADKKALNTEILDVSKMASFTEYLVITCGESPPQLRAISKSIDEGLLKTGLKKSNWEGKLESNWLILDLGSVVVHVMSPEERQKYGLEEIWGKTAVTYHL
ncbi:ribosome silencing factor [Candidatus Margulisiibacteriota bacterium]